MRAHTCIFLLALALALPFPLHPQEPAPALESPANTPPAPDRPGDRLGAARGAAARGKPVENADIIAMSQSQLGDDALLSIMELNDIRFDVSAEGLIALKKAGVSDRVISAMLESTRHRRDASAAASAAEPRPALPPAANDAATPGTAPSLPGMPAMDPQTAAAVQSMLTRMGYGGMGSMAVPGAPTGAGMPRVFVLTEAAKSQLSASTAQRAVSKFRGGGSNAGAALSSLAGEALSFASIGAGPAGIAAMSGFSMFSGLLGGTRPSTPTITYAWGLPGAHSGRVLPGVMPSFELLYKDIPGIDPDAFEPALVQLAPTKDNYRLVGATREKLAMQMEGGATPADWVAEDRLPVHLQKRESGAYTLRVEKSLRPGEYAVVLRPVKHYKAQPSAFGGAEQLSSAVWDFSLSSVAAEAAGRKHN